MPNCCVPGCGNKSSDPRCVDITFHRLPINNKDLLKIWIEKLNLTDQQVIPEHHRVCGEHFDITCFKPLLSHGSKRCLISGCVPNKFDPITANTLKSNSENIEENMVQHCAIYGCKYRKRKNCIRGIMFHSFPTDRERLTKWLDEINSHSLKPLHTTKNMKICQMHFKSDDYVFTTIMSPIGSGVVETKQLKPNAIPTIFEVTDTPPTTTIHPNIRTPQQQPTSATVNNNDNNTSIISNYQQQMLNVLNNRSINSDITATTANNHPALLQQQHQQFYNSIIPNYDITNYMFNNTSNNPTNNNSSVGNNNNNLNSNTTSHSDDYNDEYSDDDDEDDDDDDEDGDEDGEEYENEDDEEDHKLNQQNDNHQQQQQIHTITNTFPMTSSISSVCPSTTSSASSTCDDNEVNNHHLNTDKDDMMLNDDINNKQSTNNSDSQLNRSNTSSQGSAKKRGLSDVINKLTKQHSSSNTCGAASNSGPQTSSQNSSPIAQNSSSNTDSVSPQTAIINAVASATGTYQSISPTLASKLEETVHQKRQRNNKTTTPTNNNNNNNIKGNKAQNRQQNQPQQHLHQQQQQQQSKTPINQKTTTTTTTTTSANNQITINQVNKPEMDLYRLLEKANLLQYFNEFTKIGADDINQLSEEFNEIIQLVGMDSKPLHVKRLRKALDEYKNEYKIKTEYNNNNNNNNHYNDTYDAINTNINTKFNLNSPAATTNSSTHSTYDSGIHSAASSTIYNGGSGGSIKLEPIYNEINNQSQPQQQQQQQLQLQNQHQQYPHHHHHHHHHHHTSSEQRNSENHHDDTQYDSNGEMNPHDYKNFKTSGSHSSESHCTSDEDDDGSLNNSDEHNDQINSSEYQNDSGAGGNNNDNSYILKNDQNEKNAKKNHVIELYKSGEHNVRKLHTMTGVPLTTVYRVIGKLKGINYNIPRGNGAGRKTILDTHDREILVKILKSNPRISRKALGKELEKLTGKSIHNSTLNRELCRLKHHGTTGNVDTSSLQTSNIQSPGTPNITSSSLNSSINTPTSSVSMMKTQSPLNAQPRNVNNKLTIDTNLNSPKVKPSNDSRPKEQQQSHHHHNHHQQQQQQEPQIQIRPQNTAATSATSAAPITRVNQSTTNLNPSASLLTPSAMLAAAAAAFGYPHQGTTASATHSTAHLAHLSPLFAQMQQPFGGLNPAALAAYSQYISSTGTDLSSTYAAALAAFNKSTTPTPTPPTPLTTISTTSQNVNSPVNSNTFQLDNDYIKLICNETKKFCESLPKLEPKPLSNMRPEMVQQIMDLVNDTTKESGKGREDTIRQLTNYLTKFDTKRTGDKMLYDYCLNEVTIQLCIQRPVLLTRRDDLLTYGKQILYNLNIFENTTAINNGKRSATAVSNTENNNNNTKRAKYEANTVNQENSNYLNPYSTNMLYNPMVANLAHLNKQIQESLTRSQHDLKNKLQVDQLNDKNAASSPLLYQQLNDEARKYSESLNEQSRLTNENLLKRDTKNSYNYNTNKNNDRSDEDEDDDEHDGNGEDDNEGDDEGFENSDKNMIINEHEHDTNSHSTMDENENANAIASIEMENAQLAGEYNYNNHNNEHENENDKDASNNNNNNNNNNDDDENINVDEIDEDNNSELKKTDSNNNRSFH